MKNELYFTYFKKVIYWQRFEANSLVLNAGHTRAEENSFRCNSMFLGSSFCLIHIYIYT